MSSLTQSTCVVKPSTKKPRKKPERKIRLLARLDTGAGILQVTEGPKADRYFFAPIPSDFGTAFTVEKWTDATEDRPAGIVQTYHVCLHGKASLCGCKGFLRFHHCRHIEGLAALAEAGKLTTPVCRKPEPETADQTMARVLLSPTAMAHRNKPAPCPHEHVFQHEDGELCCADCSAEM